MPSTDITFTTLPRSHSDPSKFHRLTTLYKSFRLLSLRLSPESFGSSYAREVAFPWDTWTSRLSNPLATTIVAYKSTSSFDPAPEIEPAPAGVPATPDNVNLDAALSAEWLASLTIIGPLDTAALATSLHLDPDLVDLGSSQETGTETDTETPTRQQHILNGMYVVPSARGEKLGIRILEHVKDLVASEARSQGRGARISLIVDYDNAAARKTYERCGFEVVHRYWFGDYREGRGARTEAAVMVLDIGCEVKRHVTDNLT
ncbi:Putative GNAT domain, acyl-CoA N-acyltransferase [Colletotrichum destructivum]|uniref:GNAT domain, acyl-CoA N-acyltransferase n=1 Tax=Colletotrichum destructivum TaxID=34406 RepID=A0AAX4I7Y3_9PEZI|nr:Putative GNAT domain, acyl-CoA N-acyltransferase [Colletotrichum destructivum]